MRILVDEDTAVQVVDALRHLLPGHQVDHITQLNWSGNKDRYVLREAASTGYDVFINKDRKQLNDPGELAAIKKSRLHHVRYSQRHSGLPGLVLALGSILAAMTAVIAELEHADTQRLVHITAVDPRYRFEIIDPAKQAPKC
jgi:PIN domain-containing protein